MEVGLWSWGDGKCFLTFECAPGHQRNSSSAVTKREEAGTIVNTLSSNRSVKSKSRLPLHDAVKGPKVSSRSQANMFSCSMSEARRAMSCELGLQLGMEVCKFQQEKCMIDIVTSWYSVHTQSHLPLACKISLF